MVPSPVYLPGVSGVVGSQPRILEFQNVAAKFSVCLTPLPPLLSQPLILYLLSPQSGCARLYRTRANTTELSILTQLPSSSPLCLDHELFRVIEHRVARPTPLRNSFR